MPAKGSWVFVHCLAWSLAAIGACSDTDDAEGPNIAIGGANEGGGSSHGALGGDGSDAAGTGSSEGGTVTQQGGSPGSAGVPMAEGGTPAMASGGIGGGGNVEPGAERLTLCARLSQKSLLASRVALTFDRAVFKDPCIGWTTELYEVEHARPDHLARLQTWSYDFWGCQDLGVEDFALLWSQPEALTAGDAKRLFDYYIVAMNFELGLLSLDELSPLEESEMRAALERLSQPLITDPSTEYSHAECLDPPAGEGGAGGGGAGGVSSGGAAGEPAVAGAGQAGSP